MLEDHIVAFADVLGTSPASQDPNEAERFASRLVSLHELLKKPQNSSYDGGNSIALKFFSDSIIMSGKLSRKENVSIILNKLAKFQAFFAASGLFLRGGVAIGGHLHTDTIDFGPALVEAVNIEKHISKDSGKISLSDDLLEYAKHFDFRVMQDKVDGNVFLDFMSCLDSDVLVDRVRQNILRETKKLEISNENSEGWLKVMAKINWLANYFNFQFPDAEPIPCDCAGYDQTRFQRNYVR